MFARTRIRKILRDFESSDPKVREGVLERLQGLVKEGLTDDDAATLLIELGRPWPYPVGKKPADAAALSCFVRGMYPGAVGAALSVFPSLSVEARAELVELLACHHHEACTKGYVALVEKHAVSGVLPTLGSPQLNVANAKRGKIILPRLLAALDAPALRSDALLFALSAVSNRAVSPEVLRPFHSKIVSVLQNNLSTLKRQQQPTPGPWMKDPAYSAMRFEAGRALDLCGYLRDPQIRAAVEPWQDMTDPHLLTFSVTALIRMGASAGADALERAAAAPAYRRRLFDSLTELGQAESFPPRYTKMVAFAESELVRWLASDFELGEEPDFIGCGGAVRHCTPEGVRLSILFKFRHKQSHGQKDMAGGVIGCDESEPTLTKSGDPFSSFAPWDSMDLAGHYRKLAGADDTHDVLGVLTVEQLKADGLA